MISVVLGPVSGPNNNKQDYTVAFLDVSGCAITQCSDQVDNDLDGFTDFPADGGCTDYSDTTE